jgi:tartrate-resistant acid phosphatase type 5
MFYHIIIFLILTNFLLINSNVAFMSIGDWGSASLGGYHYKNAIDTSNAMFKLLQDYNTKFVLNTGDNFYYCGIVNLTDPLITDDYINIYGQIKIPWYNSLGNHDYGYNPEIQLQLNSIISNWFLENRYYSKRLVFNDTIINIVVLDTSPCISDYRSNDRSKWDPCGLEFPTCGPQEDVCSFHNNILSQNCTEQFIWFNTTINNINENEWTIVIGHHRADQIDVEDFNSILQNNKIHLYINGHIHALQHYRLNNNTKFITSGGGSMVMIDSQFTNYSNDLWRHDDTGFTLHIINTNSLNTYFINKKGKIIYNFKINM